jgi:cytochrome c-type biogenesis protein CcmH
VKRLILIAALGLGGSPGLCAAAAPGQAAPAQAAAPLAAPTQDLDANGQMQDPALQARFERIAKDLRCLVCQNESIADSNVELAGDLRRQVREMLVAGRSDDAIFDFMTDRYGDFVRFNPPLERKTALIWGAPFIVLLLGVSIVFRIVRRRSRMPLDDEPSPGSL